MTVLIIFILAYALIIAEQFTRIDKAVPALIAGVLSWTVLFVQGQSESSSALTHHFAGIAEILFFLIGAMTIVELIDAHRGFQLITRRLPLEKPLRLIAVMCLLAFFLSAALDNLTTAIVMCTIIGRITSHQELRWLFAGLVVIAANAGGVWSPIGDVTTTMLWIGHRVSTEWLVERTFVASLISLIVPMVLIVPRMLALGKEHGQVSPEKTETFRSSVPMLVTGFLSLISVPVMKSLTGIPPYLAMMLALAVLWAVSEFIDPGIFPADPGLRRELSIRQALTRIEMPGILFFLGILLAVAALDSSGILHSLSETLSGTLGSFNMVAGALGLLSAIVDNVPLVAAAMNMYDLPENDTFWTLLAYCAGTGGSILIIGSAAGVAAMGMEKISFVWYLKRISLPALLGYLAGMLWLILPW